jgi:NAD(P)-dependent dehydrogenase (short-subunit alcohol dehydrogenase family)
MSSVNGVMAIPSIASYNASKGGVNQLTRAMALALADRGIRVNAVAPGTIATELARQAVLGSEEARARILSRTPMKRLGEPGEVADVARVPAQQRVELHDRRDRLHRRRAPVPQLHGAVLRRFR